MKFKQDPEFTKKRIELYKQRKDDPNAGSRDFIFSEKVNIFTPHDGENLIRLLPAMWEGAMFPWYETYIHYSIGPNNGQFLCVAKMKNQNCPICEAGKQAQSENRPEEEVRALFPARRAAAYVIDRLDKDLTKGPQVWPMPYQNVAQQIIAISFKRTGEPVFVDDPYEGWDILFNKSGKGLTTKYSGMRKDDDTTPLHADKETVSKWLQFAEDKALDKLLSFKSYEHVKAVLHGTAEEVAPATITSTEKPSKSGTTKAHLNGKVQSSGSQEITLASLNSMPRDMLITLAEDKKLGINPDDWSEDQDLASAIALEMGINA